MCCWTHNLRDVIDEKAGVAFTLAESPEFRCQCKFGTECNRRVTGEDFLCDWCREVEVGNSGPALNGHQRKCYGQDRLQWPLALPRAQYFTIPSPPFY